MSRTAETGVEAARGRLLVDAIGLPADAGRVVVAGGGRSPVPIHRGAGRSRTAHTSPIPRCPVAHVLIDALAVNGCEEVPGIRLDQLDPARPLGNVLVAELRPGPVAADRKAPGSVDRLRGPQAAGTALIEPLEISAACRDPD